MPWQLGSGNFTNYNFHITEAFFAPEAGYQNGETTLLHLIGTTDDGEEKIELFNVGKDWISTDGGKTVKSTKGGTVIPRNSMYGKMIEACLTLGDDIGIALEARGDANEAKVWAGSSWHMNEQQISWGRNLDNTYHNMPDAFLGFDLAPTSASNGSGPVAAPSVAAPKPGNSAAAVLAKAQAQAAAKASTNGHASNPLFDQALTLAKSSPDFESFVNAAISISGLTDDDELSNVVFNPEPDGFYALNH